jgi:hypothetical protein
MSRVAWQDTTEPSEPIRLHPPAAITPDPATDHGTEAVVVDLREPRVADLASVWCRTSRERLGLSRQQWYHPAVQEVLDSLDLGLDLTWPLARLGEARAAAGVSLRTTLEDLDVLAGLLPVEPAFSLDRLSAAAAVADAWLEAAPTGAEPACVDAFTGLMTSHFLRGRLEQVYRNGAQLGVSAPSSYVLVVVHLVTNPVSGFATMAQRLRAANALRACFPSADTLAVIEPSVLTALVEAPSNVDEWIGALEAELPDQLVWVERLPEAPADAVALVDELTRRG